MPQTYAEELTPEQIDNLVAYLLTLNKLLHRESVSPLQRYALFFFAPSSCGWEPIHLTEEITMDAQSKAEKRIRDAWSWVSQRESSQFSDLWQQEQVLLTLTRGLIEIVVILC